MKYDDRLCLAGVGQHRIGASGQRLAAAAHNDYLAVMQLMVPLRVRLCAALILFLAGLCVVGVLPARAFDLSGLFGGHRVTAHFATPEGKPMAGAEVRVFAPGEAKKPVLTGRTDANGAFVFTADRDGFWTAEARTSGEVARVMVRVPAPAEGRGRISPYLLFGGLVLLLVLGGWYRVLRARNRSPRS